VRELLLVGRRPVHEVVLAAGVDSAPILADIVALAGELRVPLRELSRSRFEARARTEAPQGVLARAGPLPAADLEALINASEPDEAPFLLVVDGVTDPGNLGALLRTAEGAGVTAAILPRHRAARITPTVAKAAAGAIEHVPLVQVPGIPAALAQLSDRGVWVVGLDDAGTADIYDLAVATEPVALVLGSEGRGLARLTRERCDVLAGVRLHGHLESLNVSAAAAVACFEIRRRRSAR